VTLFFGAKRPRGMAQPGEKTAASEAPAVAAIGDGTANFHHERRRWMRRANGDGNGNGTQFDGVLLLARDSSGEGATGGLQWDRTLHFP
jgi:hypothetical protein